MLAALFELHQLAQEEVVSYEYHRELYEEICNSQGRHFIGIVGARGIGKSTILKQLSLSLPQAFYLSADTLEKSSLFEITKELVMDHQIQHLLIDEIHFAPEYAKHLKKIYDFLKVRVIFSGSVALSILDSAYDLSRRVRIHELHPFSFRQYLLFQHQQDLRSLSIEEIDHKKWSLDHLKNASAFEKYLIGGLYPFVSGETDWMPLFSNMIQKVIYDDIPRVAKLTLEELQLIEKMLKFIGRSSVDGLSYSSLSKNLGITRYKAEQYVGLLQKAFILNPVFPKGNNVLKEPKILMNLPFRLLFQDKDIAIGGLREDFCAEAMNMAGISLQYLKSTRGAKTPDFYVPSNEGPLVLEVGGKGKGRSQFKGVDQYKKLILTHSLDTHDIKRPLMLLGFLS